MKVTPLASGGTPGTDLAGVSIGRTASPEKLERAKNIAQGITITESDTPVAAEVSQSTKNIRRIRMNTNATTNRPIETQTAPEEQEIPTADTSEAQPVVEDTQPLSPQFAALARQRRALQAKEREIADRERALSSTPASAGTAEFVAKLKSNPLSVLQEHGVTYDQLTEAILANQSGITPEIQALKEEIKALKEGVDKTFSDKDTQAERQVLAEIRRETERLAAEGDAYEMVRATDSHSDVVDLIHRTYKETGEILDTKEAMQLVEDELIKDALKIVNTSKIKGRLTAPLPSQQQPSQRQIKTLTNRDTARPVLDRRSRAIAAALGQLKR